MREPLLDKLNRKIGRYALKNLMTIIVIGTALVWFLDMLVGARTGYWISSYLYFDKSLILQGQIWRVITFVFVPETTSILWLALSLYFDWLIGNTLENEWGAFKFNIFYLFGVIGAIVSGFITGYATNYYLNLSLFLAFAILYPNYQIVLFFFIPIKMKWLAIIDLIGIIALCIFESWAGRIAIFFALGNIALFFWRVPINKIKQAHRRRKWTKQARRNTDDYPFEL